ncbi:MAG: Uma2 family endonuclease [Armatimonadetes bacterium]|nr:Uma2 family endonuclease [Armatimonadota bacterium]
MSIPWNDVEIPQKEVYTYEDYAKLPEGAPYQLIGGKLIMTPSPTVYHQYISTRIVKRLIDFVEEKGLGVVLHAPLDVYLEEKETYQPDIIYISRERSEIIEERIRGAPDLVVEILSPSTAYYDLRKKARVYARHGVKEYWVVDPLEESIEIYTNRDGSFELVQRAEGEEAAGSVLLEGFAVELKDIFVKIK